MGQAKKRGTREQRVAEAVEKADELRPENLVCGTCETRFADFRTINTSGLVGIVAGFKGSCPNCGRTVVAYRGDDDAVADVLAPIMAEHQDDATLGDQSVNGRD